MRLAAEFEIAKIFTSPLIRAAETAAIISRACNRPLLYTDALKERNLGPLSGLPKSEVKLKFPEVERAWLNNLPRPPLEGAETETEFAWRVQRAVESILAQTEPGSTVVVVSHGGTLNQMLKLMLNINGMYRPLFTFYNTSLTVLDVYPSFTRLVLLNDIHHLGGTYA